MPERRKRPAGATSALRPGDLLGACTVWRGNECPARGKTSIGPDSDVADHDNPREPNLRLGNLGAECRPTYRYILASNLMEGWLPHPPAWWAAAALQHERRRGTKRVDAQVGPCHSEMATRLAARRRGREPATRCSRRLDSRSDQHPASRRTPISREVDHSDKVGRKQ